jgi:hypothetical protein
MAMHLATIIEGDREVHMVGGVSDYDTSCGIDMNDSTLGHYPENATVTKDKITCPACINIWLNAKGYRKGNFDSQLQTQIDTL